jgi:hypothetical protein
MADHSDFDLDRSAGRAWSTFQVRLAEYLAQMQDDHVLIIEAQSGLADDETAGAAPYVQFTAWGGDLLRSEAVSNHYLDPTYALDEAGSARLEALGWSAPSYGPQDEPDSGSINFWLDVERVESDQVAAMTTRAFREVWSIAHPVFLETQSFGTMEDPPDLGIADAAVEQTVQLLPDAVTPRDQDHLRELVDTALTQFFGHAPTKDSDGDIPVRSGSALVFVQVHPNVPVVTLFAPLVRGISGRTRAAEVVADLNRRWELVKFILIDDQVAATVQLPALPFVARHLVAMLELLSQLADEVDEDLAEQLSGRLTFTPDDDEERAEQLSSTAEAETDDNLSEELLTLLHIDEHDRGGVDTDEVLAIYNGDRHSLLRDITVSSEQEISWRQSAEEATAAGDREEAAACSHESAAWEATVETLRRALRATMDKPTG